MRYIPEGTEVIGVIEIRHPRGHEGAVYEVSLNGEVIGQVYRRPWNKMAYYGSPGTVSGSLKNVTKGLLAVIGAHLEGILDDCDR